MITPAEFGNIQTIAPNEIFYIDADRSFDFLVNFLTFPFPCFQSLVELIIEDCGERNDAHSIVEHQYKTCVYASLLKVRIATWFHHLLRI